MLRFCETVSIVGCGGIGSWLLPPVLRFLDSQAFRGQICLWDGDHYTVSNLGRQSASERLIGRAKAEALADQYRQEFPRLRVWHRNEFVTVENVTEAVPERALIFSCVDNHPARALLARQVAARRDVCLISAGNERLDGNVCIMLRRAGKPVTASLLERHPEIATAKRGDRSQMGCEELAAAGDTQLLVTNFLAAAAAFAAFHALWTHGQASRRRPQVIPQEIYFDAGQCAMSAVPANQANS